MGCVGLMCVGNQGKPIKVVEHNLLAGTTIGFTLILLLLIIGRVEGGMPAKVEILALLLGTILFIASGGYVIDTYKPSSRPTLVGLKHIYEPGLALGSMCIINALVMGIDAVL